EERERRSKPASAPVDSPYDMSSTILSGAFVRAALDGVKNREAAARSLVERVLAHLRAEAELWRADAEALHIAESTLRETVDDIIGLTESPLRDPGGSL